MKDYSFIMYVLSPFIFTMFAEDLTLPLILDQAGTKFGTTYSIEYVVDSSNGSGNWRNIKFSNLVDFTTLNDVHTGIEKNITTFVLIQSPDIRLHYHLIDKRLILSSPANREISLQNRRVPFLDIWNTISTTSGIIENPWCAVGSSRIPMIKSNVDIPVKNVYTVRWVLSHSILSISSAPISWELGVPVSPTEKSQDSSLLSIGQIKKPR